MRRRKVVLIKLQRCFNVRISVYVSENATETQINNTMTFTVLIVSIEQNEEFQESRVHYTLAGIKSLLKIGEEGFLGSRRGGSGTPGTSPGYAPVCCMQLFRERLPKRSIKAYGKMPKGIMVNCHFESTKT